MSKGSKRRPGDEAAYRRNFDAIFASADDPADARYEIYPLDDAEQEQRVREAYAASEARQECDLCVEYRKTGGPPHKASPQCRSGGRPHCSCDVCF